MRQKVRVTGILIENEHILLLEQKVTDSREWSLPGGALEVGETIEQCMIREMKEETGLDIVVEDLLYVCDRLYQGDHVVHMTFLIKRSGGNIIKGIEPEPGANIIRGIKMVPFSELPKYGFSPVFCELVESDFPDRGTYKGNVSNIGL